MIQIKGIESKNALLTPVTKLVAPGPLVATQSPISDLDNLEKASAPVAADSSCCEQIILIFEFTFIESIICKTAPPDTIKQIPTPFCSRYSATKSLNFIL